MAATHLTFAVPSSDECGDSPPLQVHLHQAPDEDSNQGENETNTGFVMWPAAVLLTHHLSKHPDILRGDNTDVEGDVLELGAGCGLVGLAAASLMQEDDNDDKVIFTDYNEAVLDNLRRNIILNDYDVNHVVFGLDWFDQEESEDAGEDVERERKENTWVDMKGTEHGQVRLIVGADLIVCSNDAELVAQTIDCALMEGGQAVILGASADSRFGVSDFPDECRLRGMSVTVEENILEAAKSEEGGANQQMVDGMELSGHNQRASTIGHDFTMFTIDKPLSTAATVH